MKITTQWLREKGFCLLMWLSIRIVALSLRVQKMAGAIFPEDSERSGWELAKALLWGNRQTSRIFPPCKKAAPKVLVWMCSDSRFVLSRLFGRFYPGYFDVMRRPGSGVTTKAGDEAELLVNGHRLSVIIWARHTDCAAEHHLRANGADSLRAVTDRDDMFLKFLARTAFFSRLPLEIKALLVKLKYAGNDAGSLQNNQESADPLCVIPVVLDPITGLAVLDVSHPLWKAIKEAYPESEAWVKNDILAALDRAVSYESLVSPAQLPRA